MIGLEQNKNNNNDVLIKFKKLFYNSINLRSIKAHLHWNNIEKLKCLENEVKKITFLKFKKIQNYNFEYSNINNFSFLKNINLHILKKNVYKLIFINGQLHTPLSDINNNCWEIKTEYGTKRKTISNPLNLNFFF